MRVDTPNLRTRRSGPLAGVCQQGGATVSDGDTGDDSDSSDSGSDSDSDTSDSGDDSDSTDR
jgi:hypothetical protein